MNFIIGFYIFCALCVAFFFWFYRLLNVSKFRGGDGDSSTEVGLSEDPQGQAPEERFGAQSSWEKEVHAAAFNNNSQADLSL